MDLRERAHDYIVYARRHPGDCILHSFKRRKLLKELEDLALYVRSMQAPVGSDAYILQCECSDMLWNGFFGLQSWYYIASTQKLELTKNAIEAKVAEIKKKLG